MKTVVKIFGFEGVRPQQIKLFYFLNIHIFGIMMPKFQKENM